MPKGDEAGRRHADAAKTWRRFAWPWHPRGHCLKAMAHGCPSCVGDAGRVPAVRVYDASELPHWRRDNWNSQ